MSKKTYLGKGLEALISQYSTEDKEVDINHSIPISKIRPNKNQPRKNFDSVKMKELVSSIREKGILQPLAVRKLDDDNYGL